MLPRIPQLHLSMRTPTSPPRCVRWLEASQEVDLDIVQYYKEMPPHSLPLCEIASYKDVSDFRRMLLDELPRRYAQRVGMIHRLDDWKAFPSMRAIRDTYADAFQKLRCLRGGEASEFLSAIIDIQRACHNMPERIVPAMRAYKNKTGLADEFANAFLDDFLVQRIGTEVLCAEYVGLSTSSGPISVIDMECDTYEVVQSAASAAVELCEHHYGYSAAVDVVKVGDVRFPYLGGFLRFIAFELLKNALRATVEKYDKAKCKLKPVQVHLASDGDFLAIRIRDAGCGIQLDDLCKVYDYMYTTAPPQGEDAHDISNFAGGVLPMAGFGFGLPLSRNYARYVGGSLEIGSVPRASTDMYLLLDRDAGQLEQTV